MSRRRKKIALIGGGQIGTIVALMTVQNELGNVVILDLPDRINNVKGKVLDMLALRPDYGFDIDITATSDYRDIADADVVVITAGLPRSPNMSRDDLLNINLKIVCETAEQVKKYAPDAFVAISTNPVDTMVQAFHKCSGFSKHQVLGLSGALDSNRFKNFIAMETGLSVKDVSCMVMGGHGPTMLPIARTATVGGIPITTLLSQQKIDEIIERTRNAGTEIVTLMGQGSAYFSSAGAIVEIISAVLFDKKRLVASSALCEGEYGVNGLFIGVPCILGAGGVEDVIELELNAEEKGMFQVTIDAVTKNAQRANLI